MRGRFHNLAEMLATIDTDQYYAVVIDTLRNLMFTSIDENDNPCLFRSAKGAQENIMEWRQSDLQEYINGETQISPEVAQCDMFVVPVQIVNGMILGEMNGQVLVHQIAKDTKVSIED